ncbi:lipoate--protein ligase family protein [Candidatus Laterigemmans baculatus]|uniref:lipoate--protein ligase family protein n=1 Tax=Candidatus Laterigemmans baculatus TaxID=2770505 RepID=UPI00193C280D|nr:lipoate--protein ligase family protein [Candidatus Laterigemmans baculatus]
MQRLDWMVDSLPLNLAIDEALLQAAEADQAGEVLRLWEFSEPVVVIGRGSRVKVEVDLNACAARRVPVLRRASGGAAILAGPGCLMYSVVLSLRERPELRRLDAAHQFVMGQLAEQIQKLLPEVDVRGTCDLAWQNRKFSGNSLRVTRDHLLYHGTLLYAADLELLASCLKTPPRRPEYRKDREHAAFVTNVPLTAEQLREATAEAFAAGQPPATPARLASLAAGPLERAEQLVVERYASDAWTFRH